MAFFISILEHQNRMYHCCSNNLARQKRRVTSSSTQHKAPEEQYQTLSCKIQHQDLSGHLTGFDRIKLSQDIVEIVPGPHRDPNRV